MALVMLGGLVSCTALDLFMFPAMFLALGVSSAKEPDPFFESDTDRGFDLSTLNPRERRANDHVLGVLELHSGGHHEAIHSMDVDHPAAVRLSSPHGLRPRHRGVRGRGRGTGESRAPGRREPTRVTLTEEASKRLDIQTDQVSEQQVGGAKAPDDPVRRDPRTTPKATRGSIPAAIR
jgi:hypothetical protein